MFEDVMIDLETLDTKESAVILSIGAVMMDLKAGKLGETFYQVVDPEDCQRQGLTISASTVLWWAQQSNAAKMMLQADKVLLAIALQRLREFLVPQYLGESGPGPLRVWGNGSMFDNAILRHAYRACGTEAPWSFRDDRCFRTMLAMFPVPKEPMGVRHNALDDAISQAKTLIRIVKRG